MRFFAVLALAFSAPMVHVSAPIPEAPVTATVSNPAPSLLSPWWCMRFPWVAGCK